MILALILALAAPAAAQPLRAVPPPTPIISYSEIETCAGRLSADAEANGYPGRTRWEYLYWTANLARLRLARPEGPAAVTERLEGLRKQKTVSAPSDAQAERVRCRALTPDWIENYGIKPESGG